MEPLILAIETATLSGSICVSRGASVLASTSGDPKISHSNTLLAEIDEVLKTANVELHEVDFFAVATGPGSFTGLRIGIATVKSLSETLLKPCVGIPTLAAIAHVAGPSERTLALLPAGRGEVFAQAFSVNSSTVRKLDDPVHLPPLRMLERYSGTASLVLTGDAARIDLDLLKEWAKQNNRDNGWRFVDNKANLATHVAILALERVAANDLDQPNLLQAIYVRPSDAELKQPASG